MSLSDANLVLEYRLVEEDIRHYHASSRARKCWRSCRRRKLALALLLAIGAFLVGTCYHSQGVRSGSVALVTTLVIVGALAWSREALARKQICRIARQLGIPREVRLVVSPLGLAEDSGPDDPIPTRTFAWPEVAEVRRADHQTVLKLRPAGSVLIVPDRAFAPGDRDLFEAKIRTWRRSALESEARCSPSEVG